MKELPRTIQALETGIEKGWHTGAQLYISHHKDQIANVGIGETAPGSPMSADILTLWLSAGKPLVAIAIAALYESGQIDIHAPVCQYVPEFGSNGKEKITLAHLLSHSSGLPRLPIEDKQQSWEYKLAKICRLTITKQDRIGHSAAYQPFATWLLLGEILQHITGQDFAQYIREAVCLPLGMTHTWPSLPVDAFTENEELIAPVYQRLKGQMAETSWHTQAWSTQPAPGTNYRGPASDLGLFYESLLFAGSPRCPSIIMPETIRQFTSRHREGMFDETMQHIVDFGWGFLVNGNCYGPETVPYGFGSYCSPDTFGHGGAQSSIGFADPKNELVVVVITNGMPGEPKHQQRNRLVNNAIYQDLGLA